MRSSDRHSGHQAGVRLCRSPICVLLPTRTRSIGRSRSAARRSSTRRSCAARAATASTTARERPMARRPRRGRHRPRGKRWCLRRSSTPSTQSPLVAEGTLETSEGYAATPLTGVWANFPYLHNGSVPTLYHLLGPLSERPRIFSVMAARQFDRDRVGQLLFVDSAAGPGPSCSSCAGSATIATGSTRRVKGAATPVTTCGPGSGPTPTAGR